MISSLVDKNIASLFEYTKEYFCIIKGHDLVYVYVNPAHVELFQGRNLTGLSVFDAQPELRDTEFPKLCLKVMNDRETIIFKEVEIQVGHRVRYLNMTYAPNVTEDGSSDSIYALGTDVTEQVLAKRVVEKSAAQLKLITDKLPAFVSYTDKEGRYQFLNAMYEKWFQRPVSELLGKRRKDIAPAEYTKEAQSHEDQSLQGKPSHHQAIIKKENGDYLNLDINFIPDVDPETNEVRGIVTVGTDVTTQMKALAEAELARNELHELFMQAPIPMCLLSGPELAYTMANPPFIEFVGREVMGKTLYNAFINEDIAYFVGIIEKVYKTGEPFMESQVPLEIKDKFGNFPKRYINVGYHPYKDANGKTKGVVCIIHDVTDQVNAVILRDNFMGIASHELKTPLTALKLKIQLNQRVMSLEGAGAFTKERIEKLLSDFDRQVKRLTRLVEDMLDVSRITADEFKMNFSTANFSEFVTRTVENFSFQLNSVGIDIRMVIEPNIECTFDDNRMEQVITNLLTNAIKYAPNAPLDIKLKKRENFLALSFRDHGQGIDPDYHERIFERFDRGTSEQDIGGLGLGLYISKKIVISHRGTIEVNSSKGEGAEFVIMLPCQTQKI
jgi:signal transduction histidine kinase